MLLSQNGTIVLDNDNDGKSDSGVEKEKKGNNEETKDTKRAIKAVKNSAVGGWYLVSTVVVVVDNMIKMFDTVS